MDKFYSQEVEPTDADVAEVEDEPKPLEPGEPEDL